MTESNAQGLLARAYTGVELEKLAPSELEELAAEIARKKESGVNDEVVKKVDRLLKAYYKGLASSTSKEMVSRVPAEKAGLRSLPKLPPPASSIGDVNLLMSDISIVWPPLVEVLKTLSSSLIETTGGVHPKEMGIRYIAIGNNQAPRMMVRWDIPRVVSADELHTMLQLVRSAYERNVTGYKTAGDGWQVTTGHQDVRCRVPDSGKQGIYMGPSTNYMAYAPGLFVYRKFKSKAEAAHLQQVHPVDWLARFVGPARSTVTSIELVDSGVLKDSAWLGQDTFLTLVTQISYLLRRRALIESAPLWTTIFRELNRVGTKAIDRDSLYGARETLRTIERVMLLPYEKPEAATILRISGESVLLVGVPGVGKTMIEHYLMASEYNAIFAAVDSDAIRADLAKSKDGESPSVTLMRVDRIIRRSTLPVVLIIDDIDILFKEDGMVSKFLNMMQGIRQKGLLVFASTNYYEKIDSRLLEPGRLSKVVHVRLPDQEARLGVLMVYLKHLPFVSDNEKGRVARLMAERTGGWSHRYLWELTQDAARHCVADATDAKPVLTLEHFERSFPELATAVSLAGLTQWDARIGKMVAKRDVIGFDISRSPQAT